MTGTIAVALMAAGLLGDSTPIRIWLQIVPAASIRKDALERVAAETRSIWAPYNVIVLPTFALSDLDRREGDHRIRLIVRDAPANRIDGRAPRGFRGLASITFDGPAPSDVVYASIDCARAAVGAAGLEGLAPEVRSRLAARLLGRAVAHELGHYILGSKAHSKRGLMRASFGPAELMAEEHHGFRLEPWEVVSLRRKASRNATTPARSAIGERR